MVWALHLVVVLVVWAGFAGQSVAETSAFHPVRGNFEYPVRGAPAATLYGKSLPPVGYVDFCGRGEAECQFSAGHQHPMTITGENWDAIFQVNKYANAKIRPATDMEL